MDARAPRQADGGDSTDALRVRVEPVLAKVVRSRSNAGCGRRPSHAGALFGDEVLDALVRVDDTIRLQELVPRRGLGCRARRTCRWLPNRVNQK